MNYRPIPLFALMIMISAPTIRAQCTVCNPCDLNSGPLTLTRNGINWNFNYSATATNSDVFPTSQANFMPGILSSNLAVMVDAWGFKTPWVSTLPNFNLYAYDSDNIGTYQYDCITVDAPQRGTSPEQQLRKTVMHEQFHAIQSRYLDDAGLDPWLNIFPWWYAEGTARFMDDRVYTDLDAGGWNATFWSEVANNTIPNTGTSLFDLSYGAALFWSYCAEQFGGAASEPGRGYPFVRKLWENTASECAAGSASDLGVADLTIRQMGGHSLNTVYHDYSICNLLQAYNVTALSSALQAKYTYIDQLPCCNAGGAAYGAVPEATPSLPSTNMVTVGPYAARYQSIFFSDKACQLVGFVGESTEPMGFAVVARGGTGRTNIISLAKGQGTTFARAIIGDRSNTISGLTAILTGLEKEADVEVVFDSGAYTLDILRPTFQYAAYPGPYNNPGRILVKTKVTGPPNLAPSGVGSPSVLGLSADQFSVLVGTQTGTVLSSTYVGGEYWLNVAAPTQTVNGSYNLTVFLCDDSQPITESLAVLYGDIAVDHVVVIDQSGSMVYPDAAKLNAAKAAAKLYVDVVQTNDRVAVVRFSGDGAECNEDAVDIAGGLKKASPANAASAKTAIDGIAAAGRTSIGDGLWKALGLLTNAPPASGVVIRTVCLLSDGMENESRYWSRTNCIPGGATVKSSLMATGIVVQSIALGPDADQGLMQEIGLLTGGDFGFVDVNEGPATARQPLSALTESDRLHSRLSQAYMGSLVKNRQLDQIVEQVTYVGGNTSVTFAVPPGFVEKAVFHLSWSNPTNVNILLRDPTGGVITAAHADIRTSATHKVYQLYKPATNGTYTALIEPIGEQELYSGLIGRSFDAVELQLQFSQVMRLSDNDRVEGSERFVQGQPVQIIGVLDDRYGAITRGTIAVDIRKPDGTKACGPVELFDDGAHGDGAAGDGVYGALFTETDQSSSNGNDADLAPTTPPAPARGSYRVEARASGLNGKDLPFTVNRTASFHIYSRIQKSPDADGNGLIDTWEVYYAGSTGLLTPFDDPDQDGLRTIEEYTKGTHPLRPDTDLGGENDGSEVAAGRCPVRRDDDLFPAPISVHVLRETGCGPVSVLKTNANIIQFPRHPSYRYMVIESALNQTGTWSVLTALDLNTHTGTLYTHQGLTNKAIRYYRLHAKSSAGDRTPYSRIVQGIAKSDPFPPRGWIRINNGYPKTDRTNLLVRLDRSNDSRFFRISARPITGAEPLLTITTNHVTFGSQIRPGTQDLPVHVVYYDDAMNASYLYSEQIRFDPTGDDDGDTIPNQTDPDDDNDGVSDTNEVYRYYTNAFSRDTDGDGVYDSNEVVRFTSPVMDDTDGDGLTDAYEIERGCDPLNPDTDADGLPDGWEDTIGKDPTVPDAQADSDADGLNDAQEYMTGTDPRSNASRFDFQPLGVFTNPGNGLRFSVPTRRGQHYRIQSSTNLFPGDWSDYTNFVADDYTAELTLPAQGPTNRNYRVLLGL